MRRPALLVALLASLSGVALGEAAPNLPEPPEKIPSRVAKSIPLWSDAELRALGGSTPSKFQGMVTKALPKAGKFIKYGGNYFIAAGMLKDALDWLDAKGQLATDANIKRWYDGRVPNSPYTFPPSWDFPNYRAPGDATAVGAPSPCYADNGTILNWTQVYSNGGTMHGVLQYSPRYGEVSQSYGNYPNSTLSQYVKDHTCGPRPEQSLNDFLNESPGSAANLKRWLGDYIEAHPNQLRPNLTPPPNENEWEDNPYIDKTADSDKDGVPDYVEWEDYRRGGKGDPNDPAKKPLGAPFEVKRDTTTTRNPDGSTTRKTVIEYSDGTTATEEVTTKTTKTLNPDGSTTTTTTTTTTWTDRNGETTTRSTSRSETTPASEPGSNPNEPLAEIKRQQNNCISSGGWWNGSACEPPGSPDDAELNCKQQGGTWLGSSCRVAQEDRREEKCLSQGRTWDNVNGTCGSNPEEDRKKAEEEKKKAEEEKKKQEDEKKNACEVAGRIWDGVEKTCGGETEEKKKADCEKKGGEWKEDDGKCGKEEEPVNDTCGDMSFKRLMAHPGSFAKDLVFPCEDLDDMFKPCLELLKTKFPFSVAASLDGWFKSPGGTDTAAQLPANLAIIPLEWGWLSGLWSTIKTLVGVALWAWFIYWLIDRFAPRTQI